MSVASPRPIALVTGGARRVGRATVLELARSGFDVHLTTRSMDESVQRTVDDAHAAGRAHGVVVTPHVVELEEIESTEAWGRDFAVSVSALDALVNNASSYDRSEFGRITSDDCQRHFRVNAVVPALLTQALAPALKRSRQPGGGAVIMLNDMQTQGRPQRGFMAYGMSKAALDFLVMALAVELAPQVRVIGVAPGVVAWPEGTPQADIDAYERRIPLARSGTPEDAALLIRSLIVDARYVTGEIVRLDGGRWLR